MGVITLEGIEFFAYHGFHAEEQTTGNRYSVDVRITADLEQAARQDDLAATVDYSVMYRIVREEMQIPSKLLEHVAERVLDRLYQQFPHITLAEVRVAKHNPPVGGICGCASVTLTR